MNSVKLWAFLYSSIISLFFVLLYSPSTLQAENLAGPAFIDPSKKMTMPQSWQQKPLTYMPEHNGHDIVITLDQHLYPAMKPLIDKYALEHNLKISISEGTCGISAGKLMKKQVDIGGFCCPPGQTDRLPGLQFHTIGIASLALIVNQNNPVNEISLETARRIFAGEILRWPALDVASSYEHPIIPVVRLHCKQRPGHWRLLLDNENLFGYNIEEVGAIQDMIQAVATNKRVIGYEVLWNPDRYSKKVKVLKVNGYSPADEQHMASLKYPLYRTYNITSWIGPASNKYAQELVRYLVSKAGDIDNKFAIIPQNVLHETGWKFMNQELVGNPKQ